MKDSKTIRNEHQSFVDAWKKIQEDYSSAPVEEGYKDVKKMLKTPKKGYKTEKVLVRKSGAFTALAEKYSMSPKQFGRYVEANQYLFDIPTRKKATLANKFQGFKETKEWDEFFGDLELVEMGLLKKNGKFKMPDDKKDIIDDGKGTDYKKIFKLKKGANLDKAHYEPEGELVDEGAPYEVTNADKSGNTPAYQGLKSGKKNAITGKALYKAAPHLKLAHNELEGEDLQEITTKDTKSGTKFKVRVKDKATGSSYIRFATRDKIAQLRSDPKIASVEMTDEGQTPEERGEKKAQAAGGGSPKKAKKDYDGDGKIETGSQEYLGSRDKAIKKAMKKRSVTTEDSDITEMDRNMLGGIQAISNLGPKMGVGLGGMGVGVKAGQMIHDTIKYARERNKLNKKVKTKTEELSNEETLEERVRGGGASSNPVKPFQIPTGSVAGSDNTRGGSMRPSSFNKPINKTSAQGKTKTTTTTTTVTKPPIRKIDPAPFNRKETTTSSTSTPAKKMSGKERAQAMAKARIASGKTISQVKADNMQSMKDKAKARHAAFKARRVTKEELSNWREDLKEIMGEVEKTEGKKPKSKKMKNGVCINPDTDDEKNKYEEVNAQKVAENLGAELQSLKIEDADGNVAYEVVDLVKPDPIKENVLSEVEDTNMFPKGTQEKVKNILDKGSNFMKNTKVGRVLKKVFGPSNPR